MKGKKPIEKTHINNDDIIARTDATAVVYNIVLFLRRISSLKNDN